MSDATVRLELPMIDAGQAQKEITHNEALLRLDLLVQGSVREVARADPPVAPVPGEAWIVGGVPTDAWAGHAGEIAAWTTGGWRFVSPCEGMALWCEAAAATVRYHAGAWEQGLARANALLVDGVQVVGARGAAIAEPTAGTTVDARARTAIGQILAALRAHGLIAP